MEFTGPTPEHIAGTPPRHPTGDRGADMTPSETYESGAIDDVIAEFRRRGHVATMVSRPEDDPNDPLTIDARIKRDDCEFGLELVRVVREREAIAAERRAQTSLEHRLEELAVANDVNLHVVLYPPRWKKGEAPPDHFYDEIVDRAAAAAAQKRDVNYASVRIIVSEGSGATISFWTSDTPEVHAQLRRGLESPLAKKRSGQLSAAADAGLPMILLLDQCADPGSLADAQWLPTLATFSTVIDELLPESDRVVDEVWLRRPDRTVVRLRPPEVGTSNEPLREIL